MIFCMFNIIGLVWANIHSTGQSDYCPIMSPNHLSAITNRNPSLIDGAYPAHENV
jgi:hypothetical protein